MTGYTKRDILDELDDARDSITWPDFRHPDYNILAARLAAYRDDKRWAIVFSMVQWDPASSSLIVVQTEPVGNCIEIPDGDECVVRRFDVVHVEFDSDNPALEKQGYISEVYIRGKPIELDALELPEPTGERDETFWLSAAVAEQYCDALMPTDTELAHFFPDGLPPKFMEMDAWHHPGGGQASRKEVFKLLAEAIVEGQPDLYQPTEGTNTDWRQNLGKGGDPYDEEEEDEEQLQNEVQAKSEGNTNPKESQNGLTGEQRKLARAMVESLRAEAMRTDSIDHGQCVAAFRATYAAMKLGEPEFMFFSSPKMALLKVQSMIPSKAKYASVLGEEVSFCRDDYHEALFERNLPDKLPFWPIKSLGSLQVFMDMGNVVNSGMEAVGKGDMLYYGNNSFWLDAEDTFSTLAALQACGAYEPSAAYIAGMAALATCGHVFAYERYCFISERPASFHHPELSKEAPRDRIIVTWSDGFICDEELWF